MQEDHESDVDLDEMSTQHSYEATGDWEGSQSSQAIPHLDPASNAPRRGGMVREQPSKWGSFWWGTVSPCMRMLGSKEASTIETKDLPTLIWKSRNFSSVTA
eukprot:5725386-Amphidinium_carterae.2